ncbi:hypothetical protein [Formosa algae]|uniref:Uncharacterized protein n=1 Tax=Formosa algae TaxID=225843 RepID=A0A9X0YKH1_9FLAO|nr:hypothetical protein [Formosa algae]MBP1838581.1 hypothetical protein [Formosa algae]MDQ0335081.1 hypothetical protein [Formosa algae]OEI79581.1 hypothetical protein AST99_13510 [Formosa algae]
MTLSAEQIEKLYQFTRKHFVEFYDVQTELVDHLANDIEEQWETNPEDTFEAALDISFKKFGVFGFQEVLEAKAKALNKYYWRAVWDIYKCFFTLPKLMFTLAMCCLSFLILKYTPHFGYTLGAIAVAFFALYLGQVMLLNKAIKQEQKKTGRKWMYQELLGNLGGLIGLAGAFVQGLARLPKFREGYHDYSIMLISIGVVGVALLSYVTLFILPEKITTYLKEEYKAYYV